jgi:hypothetical protein
MAVDDGAVLEKGNVRFYIGQGSWGCRPRLHA